MVTSAFGRGVRRHGHAGRRLGDVLAFGDELGQAEVENLHLPRLGDEDVRRLDVAMDDALRVRGAERFGDLHRQVEHGVELQLRRDALAKRLPLEQLHHDEGLAVVLFDVVNRADVRMVQCGGRARLAAEPIERLSVAGKSSGRNLSATNRPSRASSAL